MSRDNRQVSASRRNASDSSPAARSQSRDQILRYIAGDISSPFQDPRWSEVRSETEEALMRAYQAADVSAFAEMYRRLAPDLLRYFLRSCRNATVAADLVQTTFMKIHHARRWYLPDRPLRPWVFAIAANALSDARRRCLTERVELMADMKGEPPSTEEQASVESADFLLEESERAALVRAAINNLPATARDIIRMHRYEGMTLRDSADVLGITEGAAKLRVFRAYHRLRAHLEQLL